MKVKRPNVVARVFVAAAALSAAAPVIGGGVQFFASADEFDLALQEQLKIDKAYWNFKPDNLMPDTIVVVGNFLDIKTHPEVAPTVWDNSDLTTHWPPEVDNVQFVANANPQGDVVPALGGLFYAKAGFHDLTGNMLGANAAAASFDIISGPPAGDNHTAIGMEILTLAGLRDPFFIVTVYDKQGNLLSTFTFAGVHLQKYFVGILLPSGESIGRVDIWDPNGGLEGIASFSVYQQAEPGCPWDCADNDGIVGILDFLQLLAAWNMVGAACDIDGGGVGILDFLELLANWGPCP